MQTMNISLPEPLKEFIDEQVRSGRYGSVSEYVRELVRQDEKRRAQEQLESLLLEGLRSSAPKPMTRGDWDEIRRNALARVRARGAKNKRG